MKKLIGFLVSHGIACAIGFGLGVYALPILIAAKMPTATLTQPAADKALYTGEFVRSLADSDFLHWGEGEVFISASQFILEGKLAPGPNYKLYFSPVFVETEADFKKHKSEMIFAANIHHFENIVVDLAADVKPEHYNTVIIWCEAFSELITATRYEPISR